MTKKSKQNTKKKELEYKKERKDKGGKTTTLTIERKKKKEGKTQERKESKKIWVFHTNKMEGHKGGEDVWMGVIGSKRHCRR